jgi:hypothetical protein
MPDLPRYTLGTGPRPSITCGTCRRKSYHPRDVAERYCGWCHVFHDGADLVARTAASGATTYVICDTSRFLADDVAAACARCRIKVYHRPHSPTGTTKLCPRCGAPYMAAGRTGITAETQAEIALLDAKTGRQQ